VPFLELMQVIQLVQNKKAFQSSVKKKGKLSIGKYPIGYLTTTSQILLWDNKTVKASAPPSPFAKNIHWMFF
jgi:hypothetical protein